MRMRSLALSVGAAALAVVASTTPAVAGTGSSTWCSDTGGYAQVPILTYPITVGIEVSSVPGSSVQQLVICYGTGAVGQPNTGTGGAIAVQVATTTSTVYPGAFVRLACVPDYVTGFAPSCDLAASADFALDDVAVSTPPTSVCLVDLGSGCVAHLPGVMVQDGNPSRALLQIRLLGTPVDVQLPSRCIALVVTCP